MDQRLTGQSPAGLFDSRILMCLWETPLNHSTPLAISKWMPSEDEPCSKESSIIRATSSCFKVRRLFFCISLFMSLMWRSHYFILIAIWSCIMM